MGGNVGVEGLGKLIMFVAIIYCIVYYNKRSDES